MADKIKKKRKSLAKNRPPLNFIPQIKKAPHRPIVWTEELIEIERLALEKWINNKDNYFFTSFANERNLDLKQIHRFAEMSASFSQAYMRALAIQEQRIVEAALSRKFDGNFAKFVLQNKSGWKEKSEVSGDSSNPLSIILDRVAQKSRDPLQIELEAERVKDE